SIHSIDVSTKRVTIKIREQKINQKSKKEQNWEATIKKYKKGDFVNGTVKEVVNFGYFIKIDTGLEGLLHKNDIKKRKKFLSNESIQVKIIKIDTVKKQIAFSY